MAALTGEVAVPCNLQSAVAGVNASLRAWLCGCAYSEDVEERVLRDQKL